MPKREFQKRSLNQYQNQYPPPAPVTRLIFDARVAKNYLFDIIFEIGPEIDRFVYYERPYYACQQN